MRMIFGAIGGMKFGRGTEVLGENLPQRHFVHHKIPHGRPREQITNKLNTISEKRN
jgi:hypothetical protein